MTRSLKLMILFVFCQILAMTLGSASVAKGLQGYADTPVRIHIVDQNGNHVGGACIEMQLPSGGQFWRICDENIGDVPTPNPFGSPVDTATGERGIIETNALGETGIITIREYTPPPDCTLTGDSIVRSQLILDDFTEIYLQYACGSGKTNIPTDNNASRASEAIVTLYPGYPGYRGALPGLVGRGDTAYLSDLRAQDPSFDRQREDAENLRVGRELGIQGPPEDWTWEAWMAIAFARGFNSDCYSCYWGAIPAVQPIGPNPAGPYTGTDEILMSIDTYTMNNAFAVEHNFGGGAPSYYTDGELRVMASLVYFNGTYPTIPQLQEGADQLLGKAYCVEGYRCGYFSTTDLLRVLSCQGGYVPVTAKFNPQDQIYLYEIGLLVILSKGDSHPFAVQAFLNNTANAESAWLMMDPSQRPLFSHYMADYFNVQCG